jgi:hypothetical protein
MPSLRKQKTKIKKQKRKGWQATPSQWGWPRPPQRTTPIGLGVARPPLPFFLFSFLNFEFFLNKFIYLFFNKFIYFY